jgi:hypothetical protein
MYVLRTPGLKLTCTLLSLSLLASAGSGCYSTWDISRDALRDLDGYRSPGKRGVVSTQGESVEFDQKSKLVLLNLRTGTSHTTGPFAEIKVNGPMFTGQHIDDPQGIPFEIDLRRISGLGVQVKRYSPGKTAGLVIGLGVGLPAAVLGITAAAIFRNFRY